MRADDLAPASTDPLCSDRQIIHLTSARKVG
jgi:hypothetical protein